MPGITPAILITPVILREAWFAQRTNPKRRISALLSRRPEWTEIHRSFVGSPSLLRRTSLPQDDKSGSARLGIGDFLFLPMKTEAAPIANWGQFSTVEKPKTETA